MLEKLRFILTRRKLRGKNEDTTIKMVVIKDPLCIFKIVTEGLLDAIASIDNVYGLIVAFSRDDYTYALRVLESKLISHRVELEYNPDNVKAKIMLDILTQIRDEIGKYRDPVKPAIGIMASPEAAENILAIVRRLGCKSLVRNFRLKEVFQRTRIERLRDKFVIPISAKSLASAITSILTYYTLLYYPLTEYSIPIGSSLLYRSSIVYIPVKSPKLGSYHTVITGPTGRGKTYLLSLIALMSLVLLNYEVYVVDPKGDLRGIISSLGLSGLGITLINDLEEVDENVLYNPRNNSSKVVIIDEAWRFSSHKLVQRLFREGRSRGLSVIVASQQPDDMPLNWWNNASNVVMFGGSESRYLRLLERYAGISEETSRVLRGLSVGEALVKFRISSKAIPVRIWPLSTIKLRGAT